MVLIESLACGTPVVSYDCPTGPKEIVRHEKNGLLVPKDDKSEMTSALNRMINDVALYEKLCFYAKQSVSHLSMEKIAKEWKALIEQN
jgi:glycosyltransferase involved in cell wall biosynthesis